ncbi:hypothetical protein Tco_0299326 [Tanacetum coccineum]
MSTSCSTDNELGENGSYLGGAASRRACSHGGSQTLFFRPALRILARQHDYVFTAMAGRMNVEKLQKMIGARILSSPKKLQLTKGHRAARYDLSRLIEKREKLQASLDELSKT